jgi:hypothetical protein
MARRVDANQKEVVKAFRDMGCTVLILSDMGKGCPDVVVGLNNCNYLVEIKNGKRPLSGQKLTFDEQAFFDTWRGQVDIIRSIEEAVLFIKAKI